LFKESQMLYNGEKLSACAGLLVASLLTATALASPINPGGTLTPVPVGALPIGTTVYTQSSNFDIQINRPLPQLPVFVRGTFNRSVIRLSDNTLTFRYQFVSRSDSQVVMAGFNMRDFAGFDTDVTYQSGIFSPNTEIPTSITRSTIDGSTLSVNFSTLGFIDSRPIIVRTDATSYNLGGTTAVFSSGFTNSLTFRGTPRPTTDSTPPVVTINEPDAFDSVCNPALITGSVSDPEGFDNYRVEYSADQNGPWTLIGSGTSAVTNGTLASWNTTAIAQGYYFIRVTAENTSGLTSSTTTITFVDKQFDSVIVRSPVSGNILGGIVCFDGTVNDAGHHRRTRELEHPHRVLRRRRWFLPGASQRDRSLQPYCQRQPRCRHRQHRPARPYHFADELPERPRDRRHPRHGFRCQHRRLGPRVHRRRFQSVDGHLERHFQHHQRHPRLLEHRRPPPVCIHLAATRFRSIVGELRQRDQLRGVPHQRERRLHRRCR
jgi:hypothetical protein